MLRHRLPAFAVLCLVLACGPVPQKRVRAPVVFAHGQGAPAAMYENLVPLKKVFAERGYVLHVARTPTFGTLAERAEVLAREIRERFPDGPFHIVGHSMGGLDARAVVAHTDLGQRALSITTLATPHHGSPVAAEWIRGADGSGISASILQAAMAAAGCEESSVRDLTPERMARFNDATPDRPGVGYFSVAFYVADPVALNVRFPHLWATHQFMRSVGYPENDGLVSVGSASWGKVIGVFEGDHMSETAPVPYGARNIYTDVFRAVLDNLDSRF